MIDTSKTKGVATAEPGATLSVSQDTPADAERLASEALTSSQPPDYQAEELAAAERILPRPVETLARYAWYCRPEHHHLAWPPALLSQTLLEVTRRLERTEAENRELREELDAVRAVLPSRARALSPEALTEMRRLDPYYELEVLEDWTVGTARFARGAEIRLDLFPRLEDSVRAGLLVGSHRRTEEEADGVRLAEITARRRRTEAAELEAREAEANAAAARARASALSGSGPQGQPLVAVVLGVG